MDDGSDKPVQVKEDSQDDKDELVAMDTSEVKGEDVEMAVNEDGARDRTQDNKDEEKVSSGDESGEEDDEDEDNGDTAVQSEPLATTRSRRPNAGNRMSTLILEEEDEFYTKNYGGFQEEEDDDDFDDEEEVDDEEVEEDYDVDSDFDIDETDEIAPEHQAIDEERRRKKSAYREPKRKVQQGLTMGFTTSTPVQPKVTPKPSSSAATPQSPHKHRPERSFRDSTKKKTAETIKNIESVKKKKKLRNIEPQRRWTQEEMLEEAKITEEENIKSLEIYQRLESEKLKKIKLVKKSIPAPYTTYYSSVFTNPETKERYSRNLCTYVGCEPQSKNSNTAILSTT